VIALSEILPKIPNSNKILLLFDRVVFSKVAFIVTLIPRYLSRAKTQSWYSFAISKILGVT
jgi:hypothetical protein